jgi:hypothetical protein
MKNSYKRILIALFIAIIFIGTNMISDVGFLTYKGKSNLVYAAPKGFGGFKSGGFKSSGSKSGGFGSGLFKSSKSKTNSSESSGLFGFGKSNTNRTTFRGFMPFFIPFGGGFGVFSPLKLVFDIILIIIVISIILRYRRRRK